MLDAYTVRKAIPRIVIAVIGINLSIYLCVAAIDIVNVIGRGLAELIVDPFLKPDSFKGVGIENNATNNIAFGGIALGTILGGGVLFLPGVATGAAAGIVALIIPFAITAALITLAIVFTLVIRQGLIIFLTIISPVAIALYVLPGTEKYAKKWFDLFIRTLMVYPIIAALFALSTAMAAILLGTAGASPQTVGFAKIIATMVILLAPLVLIPFAFKLAGGTISAVMNAANGSVSSMSQRAGKKFKTWSDDPNSAMGKKREGSRSNRVDRGLTSRQLWARRPGGEGRTNRINAAKSLETKLRQAAVADTARFKGISQDSDVLNSLVMTEDELNKDRADKRRIVNDGVSSPDAKKEAQRMLDAHAAADVVGRTTATAAAAFHSADRIKFLEARGEEGYNQELARAERIFGADNALEAMNQFQAVAKGPANRPDLSGNTGGKDYSIDKAFGSQSAYTLMNQGRPAAVESFIEESVAAMYEPMPGDPTKQREWRERKQKSAAKLKAMESGASGGTDGNLAVVNKHREAINTALNGYVNEQANTLLASGAIGTEKDEAYQVTSPGPGGTTTTTTQTRKVPRTADEMQKRAKAEAEARLNKESLGYSQPDPSLRE